MKKSVIKITKYVITIFAFFMMLGITACKNWMSGNLFEEIDQEVKVASAE